MIARVILSAILILSLALFFVAKDDLRETRGATFVRDNAGAGKNVETGEMRPSPIITDSVDDSSGKSNTAPSGRKCIENPELQAANKVPEEAAIAQSAKATGPDIAVYLEVPRKTVEDYAAQGDSAAMVVLARMEAMASVGTDGSDAQLAKYSRRENARSISLDGIDSDQARQHLLASSRWAYEAALHGRIQALQLYGKSISVAGRNAVDLGWISHARYEGLSEAERDELDPYKIVRVF